MRTSLKTQDPSVAGRRAPEQRLDELAVGRRGRICSVGGERLFRRRLLELGLLPGTEVTLLRRADLGGLLEVEVRGASLSLRLTDAREIRIEGESAQ